MSETEVEEKSQGHPPQKARSVGRSPLPGREELEAFVRSLESNAKSPHTVKQYRHMVEQLLDFLRKPVSQISGGDVERFKDHLLKVRGYRKNSLYAAVRAVQAFLRHLKSPVADEVTAPKRREMIPNFLNEVEVAAMVEASRAVSRDCAILMTLAYTGVRVSELCNLDAEDIDFTSGTVRIRHGKGDKERLVILDAKNAESLREYLARRDRPHLEPSDQPGAPRRRPLFLSERRNRVDPRGVERLVRKYAHAAGINRKVTPHTLRHTLATTLLRRGVDIRYIQQLLGHASVATTQIYTHVDDVSLRSAISKAHLDFTGSSSEIQSGTQTVHKGESLRS
jgi:integrase/recombinase XerD